MSVSPLKTSLIVPVYNEEHYIPKLIESIRKSTVKPDEILFCDNGSTDASVQVIKTLGTGLPIRILREKQKGITRTVERLWRQAKGDLILKVDADSVLPKHWIQNAIAHFTGNPRLMACTGTILASDGGPVHTALLNLGYRASMPVYKLVKKHHLLFGPNSAFRRSALASVNGYTWHTDGLDDQVISQKLYDAGYKTAVFADMYMYHSARRFSSRTSAYAEVILAFIHPRYYSVKS